MTADAGVVPTDADVQPQDVPWYLQRYTPSVAPGIDDDLEEAENPVEVSARRRQVGNRLMLAAGLSLPLGAIVFGAFTWLQLESSGLSAAVVGMTVGGIGVIGGLVCLIIGAVNYARA